MHTNMVPVTVLVCVLFNYNDDDEHSAASLLLCNYDPNLVCSKCGKCMLNWRSLKAWSPHEFCEGSN